MSKNILPTNGEWIPNLPLAPAVGSFHDLCEFAGWKDSRVRAYLEDPGTNPGKNSDAKNSWEVSQLFPVETMYLRTVNHIHASFDPRTWYVYSYIHTYIYLRKERTTYCMFRRVLQGSWDFSMYASNMVFLSSISRCQHLGVTGHVFASRCAAYMLMMKRYLDSEVGCRGVWSSFGDVVVGEIHDWRRWWKDPAK